MFVYVALWLFLDLAAVANAEITGDMLTQFGLISKISTGSSMLDLALCLLVPIIMQKVLPHVNDFVKYLAKELWKEKEQPRTRVRTITFTKNNRSYYWRYDDGVNPPTSVLQDAILRALNKRAGYSDDVVEGFLELKANQGRSHDNDSNRDSDSDDSDEEENHYYKPFLKAGISVVPANGAWLDLDDGVRFKRNEEWVQEGENNQVHKVVFHFECDAEDGSSRIDRLIERAFNEFKVEQRGKVDRTRYLYVPVPPKVRESNDESDVLPYKRYALSEERSFASLFHPEKDQILQLVDNFMNKTGKFAIAGYPQKLGFLLHGPPGTGKTSFIKALAQRTRRHIINIPLARIKTNQELMNIMFDQRFGLVDEDYPINLPVSKTIFVMEDVDAASDVVLKRSEKPQNLLTMTALSIMNDSRMGEQVQLLRQTSGPLPADMVAAGAPIGVGAGALMGASPGSSAFTAGHSNGGGKGTQHQQLAQQLGQQLGSKGSAAAGNCHSGKAAGTNSGVGGEGDSSAAGNTGNKGGRQEEGGKGKGAAKDEGQARAGVAGLNGVGYDTAGMMLRPNGWGVSFEDADALNLAGLLNVLDGVVDTPGRIIIMTTNHPDKLDPALIRPGRINKKIYLGRLRLAEALQMAGHYFGEVGGAEAAALRGLWRDDTWSPAELEALCAECDTLQQLVGRLQEKIDAAAEAH